MIGVSYAKLLLINMGTNTCAKLQTSSTIKGVLSMYYTYEGDNEDLKSYIEENGFILLYDSEDSCVFLVKKVDGKNYQQSFKICAELESQELQCNIARFVRSAIIEIECEIFEYEFNARKAEAKSNIRRKLFNELEQLGVKPKANYSEKELLSWEREYTRNINETIAAAQYEQMGR